MSIKKSISISLLLLISAVGFAQKVSAVYKINDLLKRIHNSSDTVYVVNFWATWCKPCVQELPEFDSFSKRQHNKPVKVILVCLDFKEELEKKVNPFLKKNNFSLECILLDEVNGNDFIDKIDPKWSGAIPATLITTQHKKQSDFFEKKTTEADLELKLSKFYIR